MPQKTPNDALTRLSVEDFKQSPKRPLAIVLDNVRSMHNVGATFRTADAFLIEKIVLCGITGQPPHREIHKTALGATETVQWQYAPNITEALQQLKEEGYTIVLVEQIDESVFLQDFQYQATQKYALVFGNEVFGVSQEALPYADVCLEIPQFGAKHSLNISVSIGVVLWDYFLKMQL